MMYLLVLDGIGEDGLKNDELTGTFYEMGEPICSFLYLSFKNRDMDWEYIAVYEKE